jgi:hypothetical protein
MVSKKTGLHDYAIHDLQEYEVVKSIFFGAHNHILQNHQVLILLHGGILWCKEQQTQYLLAYNMELSQNTNPENREYIAA